MPSLNKIELIGFLGRDPESRSFPSGDRLVTVSLSTSSKWREKDSGALREATEWHRVVFRGQLADFVERTFHKGSCIYIEGQMRYRKYKDDQNQERTIAEIHAYEVQPLDRRANDGENHHQEAQNEQNNPAPSNGQRHSAAHQEQDDDPLKNFKW